MNTSIGWVAGGYAFPEGRLQAADLAMRTGIPEEIIRTKFGLLEKRVGGEEDQISRLALQAAQKALMKAKIDPGEIDLIIYSGSEFKDYRLWSAGAYLQHAIGAKRALAFDVMALCAGGLVGLQVARAMLSRNPSWRYALLVAASREASLLNYEDQKSRFMFTFGDGAAAVILGKGPQYHPILGTAAITDGSFHDDVKVPGGGTRLPPWGPVPKEDLYLQVKDPLSLKERLDPVSLPRFLEVVDRALGEAGLSRKDLDFLFPVHMKRSMHQKLLETLSLREDQGYYLERYGHVQAADPFLGLLLAEEDGWLRDGQILGLVAAGTGYTWAAAILRWRVQEEG
ncbi:MAG: 3-oxoacyl-ACP synthase [Bacillota bacterium]|nr:3-oxoacyl-ACP synthase [Bacillota bacterium]